LIQNGFFLVGTGTRKGVKNGGMALHGGFVSFASRQTESVSPVAEIIHMTGIKWINFSRREKGLRIRALLSFKKNIELHFFGTEVLNNVRCFYFHMCFDHRRLERRIFSS